MTNPAGRKWEVRVVDFLRPVFPDMDRDRKRGRFDRGEFVGTGNWTFECKATRAMNLSEALDQAEREAEENKTNWYAAIMKRRNHATAKAYVVMPLGKFRELLAHVEELEA